MRVLIAVPSKGRSEVLRSNTLNWLQNTQYNFRVFVEPQDMHKYSLVTDMYVNIKVNDKGIGFVKKYIGNFAIDNQYDLIFKIDDDIEAWERQHSTESSLRIFESAIQNCIDLFRKHNDIKVIGFPQHYQLGTTTASTSLDIPFSGCYICRTENWHADEQFTGYESLAHYYDVLSKGGRVIRYNDVAMRYFPRVDASPDLDKAELAIIEKTYGIRL